MLLEKTRKLNVGGVTIVAKKLFNMKDYYGVKDGGVLSDYVDSLEKKDDLGDERDNKSLGYKFAFFILVATTVLAVGLMGNFGFNVLGVVVLALLVLGFNVAVFYDVYKDNKKYKEYKKEMDLYEFHIEHLEKQHPLILTLKEHANRLYNGEFKVNHLKELLTYLDTIPTGSESVDVYLYRDPKDKELDYDTNMLMFSTDDKDTYLRYEFQFVGEDKQYEGNSKVELTTIRIFQIKVDDKELLTETFTEKLKYIEVVSN